MSRSQPTEIIPNPSTRWHEWSGKDGNLKYYDKETEKNVSVSLPFNFILLDRLTCIKGWHDASESGIFSNEIRDTRNEPFVVKAFKMKEEIASGFYGDIKDRVKASGGKFTLNCYIAFNEEGGELALGSLQFHGAALSAWFTFENDKNVAPSLYKSGICIVDSIEGKKGSIKYRIPKFELVDLPPEVNQKATMLDEDLQHYLSSYFKRTRNQQAQPHTEEDDINEELNSAKPDDDVEF